MGSDPESHTSATELNDLLTAMVDLVSAWSSDAVQARIAHGVGVDMNNADIRTVHTLGRLGAARPAELAKAAHTTRPTMSKSLTRLTSSGLIERDEDPDDGRSTFITLNAEGRAVYERLVQAGQELVREAIAHTPALIAHTSDLIAFTHGLHQTEQRTSPNPNEESGA